MFWPGAGSATARSIALARGLLRVSAPMPRSRSLRARLRLPLQYAFLATTFVVILHFNVVRPYVLHGGDVAPAPGAPAWMRAPAAAYRAVLESGQRAGVALIWRMYSPVPRELRQIEWEAQDARGQWVTVPGPGMSMARRRQRTWADALLWDFKRARIGDNYFVTRYDDTLPWFYVAARKHEIARDLGSAPQGLRAVVRTAPIPAPADKGDWDPAHAVFTTTQWEHVFR